MSYPIKHKKTDIIIRTVNNDMMISPDSDITENEDSYEFLCTAKMTDTQGNFTGQEIQVKNKVYKKYIISFESFVNSKIDTKKYMA